MSIVNIEKDMAISTEHQSTFAMKSLKPEGGLIITVPQHKFLWSKADDHAYHKRRYTRHELTNKLNKSGFNVIYSTSFVTFLMPLIFLSRWLADNIKKDYDPMSEHKISKFTNAILAKIMDIERYFLYKGISY